MRRIQVLIREVDDQQPDMTRDLATFDLPATDVATLRPDTALDQLEATTHTIGTAILRRTLQAQWTVPPGFFPQYRKTNAVTAIAHRGPEGCCWRIWERSLSAKVTLSR